MDRQKSTESTVNLTLEQIAVITVLRQGAAASGRWNHEELIGLCAVGGVEQDPGRIACVAPAFHRSTGFCVARGTAAAPTHLPSTLRARLVKYPKYDRKMVVSQNKPGKSISLRRALTEIGFIVFLFYANLLMGEFTVRNERGNTLLFAMHDIFTGRNLAIALFAGVIGYFVFEYLRRNA